MINNSEVLSDKQANILQSAMAVYTSTKNLTGEGVKNMYKLVIDELTTTQEVRALKYAILTLTLFKRGELKQSKSYERRLYIALKGVK